MSEISSELDKVFFDDIRLNKRSNKILESLYEGIGKDLGASFSGNKEIKELIVFLIMIQ